MPSPRPRNSEATRSDILAAARTRFGADGYERTTLRAVAADVGVDAALVLGAAANVNDAEANPWMAEDLRVVAELLDRGVPTLGVCLGAQLLAKAAGGSVERAAAPEIGWYEVALEEAAVDDPVIGALPQRFDSFQWHSYVAAPPAGTEPLARSAHCLQAFRLTGAPARVRSSLR